MGTEQYSDLVLYRRGGFNFINSYSPVGTKGQDYLIGDGIVYTLGSFISWGNASPYPLSKWDGYSDPNYPSYYKFIGYQDGAFFENQDQQYCRKIKVSFQTTGSFSYVNFYLNIKNIREIAFDFSTNQTNSPQFSSEGIFGTSAYAWRDGQQYNQGDFTGGVAFELTSDAADFFDWFPKKSFTGWFPEQGYYQTYPFNSITPVFYLWSKVDYTITSITTDRIYLNYNITPYEKPAKKVGTSIEPDWYPSDDDSSLINYPRQEYPNGGGYYTVPCFGRNYNKDTYFYQKKGTRNIFFGYGVNDTSPSPPWSDGKNGYWAKTYGDSIYSSFVDFLPNNIPGGVNYQQRFDIYLRFQGDSHQPEYDISNNTYTDNVIEGVPVNSLAFGYSTFYNFNDTLIPMNFGAFTWPNNETLFGKWKQKLELKLYSNLLGVCTPKCIYGQKIYKFKIKWQTGNLTDVYKSAIRPTVYPSGTLRPIMRPNFTWSGYEEQIIDNIELDFEENNPYAVWEQTIECPAGQAKRLVDVCVLEIRDKT